MKFEKSIVICPQCGKATWAYLLNFRKLKNRKGEIMKVAEVGTSNFCSYCGFDFRHMQRKCEECGFTDWVDVFTGDCPYCKLCEEVEGKQKEKEGEK